MKGISDYASDRTSAKLAARMVCGRGRMISRPIPSFIAHRRADNIRGKRNAALEDFIAHGGMLLIDTVDAGEDDDNVSAAQHRLADVTRGIHLPALAKLDERHILAHCFYILRSFPGVMRGRPFGWRAMPTRTMTVSARSLSDRLIGRGLGGG